MSKRKPAFGALFVIGLAFVPLGIAGNISFLAVGIVFLVIGAGGLARGQREDNRDNKDQGTP